MSLLDVNICLDWIVTFFILTLKPPSWKFMNASFALSLLMSWCQTTVHHQHQCFICDCYIIWTLFLKKSISFHAIKVLWEISKFDKYPVDNFVYGCIRCFIAADVLMSNTRTSAAKNPDLVVTVLYWYCTKESKYGRIEKQKRIRNQYFRPLKCYTTF